MKKHATLLTLIASVCMLFGQNVNIPDANFKAKLLEASASNTIAKNLSGDFFKIDSNNDGEIQVSEADQVSYLNLNNIEDGQEPDDFELTYISDLTGLDAFASLTTYIVVYNNTFQYVVQNLTETSAEINTSVSASTRFFVANDELAVIPTEHIVRNCPNLTSLTLENEDRDYFVQNSPDTPSSKLIMEGLPVLETFVLKVDYLDEFLFAELNALKNLRLVHNQLLKNTDLTALTNLETLSIERGEHPHNGTVDYSNVNDVNVSNLKSLKSITSNGFSHGYPLYYDLEDVSGCDKLETLSGFRGNFDFSTSGLDSLKFLGCGNSRRGSSQARFESGGITELNLSGLPSLETVSCQQQSLTNINLLDAPSLKKAFLSYNLIDELDVSGHPSLEEVHIGANGLQSFNAANASNFKFVELHAMLDNVFYPDWGRNEVNYLNFDNTNISNLDLIYDSAVFDFDQALDLSCKNCTNVTELFVIQNKGLPAVNILDFEGTTNISNVQLALGSQTSVNAMLDLLQIDQMKQIVLSGNVIGDELILPEAPLLEQLKLRLDSETEIKIADFSKTPALKHFGLDVIGEDIAFLNLKNGRVLEYPYSDSDNLSSLGFNYYINLSDSENIKYVCADEGEEDLIQDWYINFLENILGTTPGDNFVVNTYCNFQPGGEVYPVEVTARYDTNNDGCDSTDPLTSNVKLDFSVGNNSHSQYTDEQGQTIAYVPAGNYTFSTTVEQPNLFATSPSVFDVNFPTAGAAFAQEICLTSQSEQSDLEVMLVPTSLARPGFESEYKLIVRNKGTTTQSGNVSLNFDANVMNFSQASTAPTATQGNLSWEVTELVPFGVQEIQLSFALNTPTHPNFPLVSDDILSFQTEVSPSSGDYTPEDNLFTLNQTVVNSFDPNDKTCLEGDILPVEKIGDYLHYTIRFENTGTANAVNVVISDSIDVQKLNIATLMPIDASHSYKTRVRSSNVVEFIFENIDLPFDDANNDGFITFKIKTNENLVLNDVVENGAEIYFDFNHPIITNETAVTVESLLSTLNPGAQLERLTLYPNPAQDTVNLTAEQDIESVRIFDLSGKLISERKFTNHLNQRSISVRGLNTGVYLLQIQTAEGIQSHKLIKK